MVMVRQVFVKRGSNRQRLLLFIILLTYNLSAVSAGRSTSGITPIEQAEDTVSVVMIGDVMMHARQMEHDMNTFLESIKSYLENADIAIANMEFSLGGKPYTGYPLFSAPDEYARYVAGCGVDIFLTANNHILDRYMKGLERTLDIYRSMSDSVLFTGISSNEEERKATYPLVVKSKGISIALVNFTYGTNNIQTEEWPDVNRMDTTAVKGAMRRAKEAGVDFIIVLPHWGNEYELRHSKSQENWAKWLVDEGADAIVGAHPHVVQDTTHIKGVPVIYSMGNAVSNMSAINTRLELTVNIKFIRNRKTGRCRMMEPELRFMWCTLPDMLTESYSTIFIDEWKEKKNEWKTLSDYDNMMETYIRVLQETGIDSRTMEK